MKVPTIAFPVLLLYACSACGGGTHGDGDAGTDAAIDDWGDATDAVADADTDGSDPPGEILDAAGDEVVGCDPGYEGTDLDLAFLGDPILPSRPPTDCGECCRQVSFLEHEVAACAYSVSSSYIVLVSTNRASPGITRIWLIDLVHGSHFLVADYITQPVLEAAGYPAIDENKFLFFHDISSGTTGFVDDYLHHVDLATHESGTWYIGELEIGVNLPSELRMSGGWAVWEQVVKTEPPSLWGVLVMDLGTGEVRSVGAVDHADQRMPEMHGDRIVYQEADYRIRLYDISDDEITDVAGGDVYDWPRFQPGIWGDVVAWTDLRAGGTAWTQALADVYMKDLSTGVESVVCDHPASQPAGLQVGEDLIVWPDLRNDPLYPNDPWSATNSDIYGYRISTGEEIQITDSPIRDVCPKIFGNRVYFVMMDDAGVLSIFEKTLP